VLFQSQMALLVVEGAQKGLFRAPSTGQCHGSLALRRVAKLKDAPCLERWVVIVARGAQTDDSVGVSILLS